MTFGCSWVLRYPSASVCWRQIVHSSKTIIETTIRIVLDSDEGSRSSTKPYFYISLEICPSLLFVWICNSIKWDSTLFLWDFLPVDLRMDNLVLSPIRKQYIKPKSCPVAKHTNTHTWELRTSFVTFCFDNKNHTKKPGLEETCEGHLALSPTSR